MQGTQEHPGAGFAAPEAFLAGLDADAAAALMTAAADVVLVVDGKGVIRDMAFGNDDLMAQASADWVGKPWVQTVRIDSRPKVEEMLRDAGSGQAVRWRQINQETGDGGELPLSFSVVGVETRKKGGARHGHTVAFGRDMRAQAAMQQRMVKAQLAMERDYWRLRHVETRYRLLFQVVSEPVLVLDAATEKLEEANPAAYALLGESAHRPGWHLVEQLDKTGAKAVKDMFSRLRTSGRGEPVQVRLQGRTDPITVCASLFRQENNSQLLVRLTPGNAIQRSGGDSRQSLAQVIELAPDAFVVTDPTGKVLTANRAFLDLAQVANEEQARGQSLDRWLGRSGIDLNVLVSNLRQSGVVRLFATRLRGEYGAAAEVEISAVSVLEGEQPCLGFTIRDVGRRLGDGRGARELPRSPGQMAELVGRMPLKDIVRETTDLIEQLCIEAALDLTGDNRASAAEMLGLSRQSLYVKLRRFNIGDSDD
jgi:transcriptional regulator PpsR